MKIAYIAPYRDGTGYARAAIENILALDSVGVEVVPRYVKMTSGKGEVPSKINELEKRDLNKVDAVIQGNLPNEFAYKGGVLNVGTFYYETDTINFSGWRENLKMMDRLVVPCEFQEGVLLNDDIKTSRTIPISWSGTLLKEPKDFGFDLIENCHVFYTISEMVDRKNLSSMLLAYFTAFDASDPVVLIVKTHLPGRTKEQTEQAFCSLVETIKNGCNLHNRDWPRVILIPGYLPDEWINSLHLIGDTYVCASKGESWHFPAIDALHYGNQLLVPENTAFKDYVHWSHGNYACGCGWSPCFSSEPRPAGIYTAFEHWYPPNVDNLVNGFEFCFESKGAKDKKEERQKYVQTITDPSMVGAKWLDMLEGR
jgi:hypothetical protein